jgi:hypothetical protein
MRKAVFTIAKNERFFIKKWYEYYSNYFNKNDIYILNHDSDDGSLDNLDCNIINISNKTTFDHVWLRSQVENFQKELLSYYGIVVFTEVDEFIIPVETNLMNYLNTFALSDENYVSCFGVEFLHSNTHYDYNKLILEQKIDMRLNNRFFNKTLITKIPLQYAKGFHGHTLPDKVDKNLVLLHLHYFDYIQFMIRAAERLRFKDTFEAGVDGIQNKYVNLKDYEKDFWINQNGNYFIDLPKVI